MQSATSATKSPGTLGQPAREGDLHARIQVLHPLSPSAQPRTQQGTQDHRAPIPARLVSNQTTPGDDAPPGLTIDESCVIAGHTLKGRYITRPDGVAVAGMRPAHVQLAIHLHERPGKLITETDLKSVIGVLREGSVAAYMGQLPKALGIKIAKNVAGVKCWVLGTPDPDSTMVSRVAPASKPQGKALDPGKRFYLQEGNPSILWLEGIEKPVSEQEFALLSALHVAGEKGVSTEKLAAICAVERIQLLRTVELLRHYLPPGTLPIERQGWGQNGTCRFRWPAADERMVSSTDAATPAAQPRPASGVSPAAVNAELAQLDAEAKDVVDGAARKIQTALDNGQWTQAHLGLVKLSDAIEEFLRGHGHGFGHGNDHGYALNSEVSSPMDAIELAMSAQKNLVLRAHLKGASHCFGIDRFPLALLRRLRYGTRAKPAINVVNAHEKDLLAAPTRALALKAVLVQLSWLAIPWKTSNRSGSFNKHCEALRDEIQHIHVLLDGLYKSAPSDERAVMVACVSAAFVPEHCSLPLARMLACAAQVPTWMTSTLPAALLEMERHASEHLGSARSSHPFAVHSVDENGGAKRKHHEDENERAAKRARLLVDQEDPNTTSTSSRIHSNPPGRGTQVAMPPVHSDDASSSSSDTLSGQRWDDVDESRIEGLLHFDGEAWPLSNNNMARMFESPMHLQEFTPIQSDFASGFEDPGHDLSDVDATDAQNLAAQNDTDDFRLDDYLNPDYW